MTGRLRGALGLVSVLAAAMFVALAFAATRGAGAVDRIDRAWHADTHRFGLEHPGWLAAAHAVTHAGDTATIFAIDTALFAMCLFLRRFRLAAFVAVVGLVGATVRWLASNLVGRARPVDGFWPAEGHAYPSGHTTNTTLAMALVVIVCWPLLPRAGRWVLVVVVAGVAGAVGLSRIAGGVHWPSDVLGGFLLATALLCAALALVPPCRRSWPAGHDRRPGVTVTP